MSAPSRRPSGQARQTGQPKPTGRRPPPPPDSRASQTLWTAAVRTGAGTAALGAAVGIVVVAIVWLPASGSAGGAGSTVRAGLLTFLAALHAGITVDGSSAAFLPLGMTMLVAAAAWHAGRALADTADELGRDAAANLPRALALQTASFAAMCAVLAGFSPLGTSHVSVAGALFAGLLLFGLAAGAGAVSNWTLRETVLDAVPEAVRRATRTGAAALLAHMTGAALLVAASVLLHHARVAAISSQVGGGWSGVPVLLLGLLAAPNAVVAGSSYLAGPGFAVGVGNGVGLGGGAHGVLPAFPVLGALPAGPAGPLAWVLVAATPVGAGIAVAYVLDRHGERATRRRDIAYAAAATGLGGLVLGWLAGGGIGGAHFAAIGPSPWQYGGALGFEIGLAAAIAAPVLDLLRRLCGSPADATARDAIAGVRSNVRGTVMVVGGKITRSTPDRQSDGGGHDDDTGRIAG